MKSKYICGVIPGSVYEGDQAVIFSSFLNHVDVAAALKMDVKGAGFVSVYSGHSDLVVEVYGESISLKINSRPEDKKAILTVLDNDD